jgi:hypothetical protein
MPRQALRAALGRATPSTTARALQLPISTTTPTSFFSTTTSLPAADDSSNGNSSPGPRSQTAAAVEKLAQLNKQRQTSNPEGSRRQDRPTGFRSILRPNSGGNGGGIDARALAATGDAAFSPSSAPKILNVRSLRGGLRSRTPFGRGGLATGGFVNRAPGGGGFGGARSGGAGRGRGGLRAERRQQIQKAKDKMKADKGSGAGKPQKLEWSKEEQAVLDRLDKGEVVPFEPKVTLDSLSGYGAAVATDAPIGQVETALRAMRLMTGGMAFNSDSGVTADLTAIKKRYLQKMPIFVHSKAEKEWIESSNPKMHLVGPDEGTKKAIIDTALSGKYETHGFAELSDVKGIMANYHARTFTYMTKDSQKFMDKVLSLLPAQGGSKPAAQAKR